MSQEPKETILYPAEPVSLDRAQVTGAFGLIAAGIIINIEKKADDLGLADEKMIAESRELLAERLLILGSGLKNKQSRLNSFNNHLKQTYELSSLAIESVVQDKYRLLQMMKRIGDDIQGNMNVNGLLTDRAKARLEKLESSPTIPDEPVT